jgi:hypothetical protein
MISATQQAEHPHEHQQNKALLLWFRTHQYLNPSGLSVALALLVVVFLVVWWLRVICV